MEKGKIKEEAANAGKSERHVTRDHARQYHRAGRWSNQPKTEHIFVLKALETANRTLGRAASVDEVSQAVTLKNAKVLLETYKTNLNQIVTKILGLLNKREKVFVAGFAGRLKYYGAVGVLNPENAELPEHLQSNRSRVLRLVVKAVENFGQALRLADILEFADGCLDYRELTGEIITQSIMSLKQTGDLQVIAIRGDGRGIHYYLPNGFSLEDYASSDSPTWLEFVLAIFNEIWSEHKDRVEWSTDKPLPVTTGEVRSMIAASGEFSHNLTDPKTLVGAMQQLSGSANPSIKKIRRRKQKAILWVPAGVEETEIEMRTTFAHDSERVEEAVKRAAQRFGRPVSLEEIEEEAELDFSLQIASNSRYFKMLADLSKVKAGIKTETGLRPRVNRRLHRIGKINGSAYYYPENLPEARGFIKFRQTEVIWNNLGFDEQLSEIRICDLLSVSIGRSKLLSQEIRYVLRNLGDLLNFKEIPGVSNTELNDLMENVEAASRQVNLHMQNNFQFSDLPQTVASGIEGWTAEELLSVVQRFYPSARNLTNGNSIQGLIGETIRKFPNPNFKVNTDKNPRLSAQFLYDEADAKMRIAKKWGGTECCLQATTAANELGTLRDERFVIPALTSEDFDQRLAAAACLAFIPSLTGNSHLRQTAIRDIEAGVRQAALWAYGFAGGLNAMEFIKERVVQDNDERVRRFAEEILFACQESWFEF